MYQAPGLAVHKSFAQYATATGHGPQKAVGAVPFKIARVRNAQGEGRLAVRRTTLLGLYGNDAASPTLSMKADVGAGRSERADHILAQAGLVHQGNGAAFVSTIILSEKDHVVLDAITHQLMIT